MIRNVILTISNSVMGTGLYFVATGSWLRAISVLYKLTCPRVTTNSSAAVSPHNAIKYTQRNMLLGTVLPCTAPAPCNFRTALYGPRVGLVCGTGRNPTLPCHNPMKRAHCNAQLPIGWSERHTAVAPWAHACTARLICGAHRFTVQPANLVPTTDDNAIHSGSGMGSSAPCSRLMLRLLMKRSMAGSVGWRDMRLSRLSACSLGCRATARAAFKSSCTEQRHHVDTEQRYCA